MALFVAKRVLRFKSQLLRLGFKIQLPQMVKDLPAVRETWLRLLGWEDLLEEGTTAHSSILAGESQGQRSLVGYSPWDCKDPWSRTRLRD